MCSIAFAAACGGPTVETPTPGSAAGDSGRASAPVVVSTPEPFEDSSHVYGLAPAEPYATDGTLPFFYDLYTFRGTRGRTVVVASFAVQVAELHRGKMDDRSLYRFSIGLTLADVRSRDVRQVHDSVYLAVRRPLGGDHLLHAFVETQATPSQSTVQRVVMHDGQHAGNGQLYTAPFPIPDYGGDSLMISDVALGLPGRQGGWRRGGVQLALLPAADFPGGDFDVYYEVYNLPAGTRYTTEIGFLPLDDEASDDADRLEPVRVRFTGTSDADADVLREHRRVGVPAGEGRYRMTVLVTDLATGRTAARARVLRIRHWDDDATLVPTCPDRMGETRPGC